MSDSSPSYLSSSPDGPDFVVAITQASISSGLWEYLAEGSQPVEYIAILSDPNTGLPTIETSLEDLLKKTGSVGPFDIPDGTPYTDPRIKYLNKARFSVGIKIQIDWGHCLGRPLKAHRRGCNQVVAGRYQSAVGRVSGKPGDGIFTAGTTGGQAQLIYEPIINYYGHGPVSPRRLRLPGGAIPTAIATARNTDGSTDLYAVAGKPCTASLLTNRKRVLSRKVC